LEQLIGNPAKNKEADKPSPEVKQEEKTGTSQ
jgi:hypothetical protein